MELSRGTIYISSLVCKRVVETPYLVRDKFDQTHSGNLGHPHSSFLSTTYIKLNRKDTVENS